MELIKLPSTIGLLIIDQLKKIGIEPRKNKFGTLSLEFTQEELDNIVELKIDIPSPGCLKGLEHCRNLKSLTIDNKEYSRYKKNNPSISDSDISVIAKITSLESLSIKRQFGISWVDVKDLVNLKQLSVVRNNSIDTIYGLNSLTSIKELSIYGNKELYKLDNIISVIKNNNLNILKLDLLNFPEVTEIFPYLLNIPNCRFIDVCSSGHNLSFKPNAVLNFHKKCLEIVKSLLEKSISNDLDAIVLIERYLAENIRYDYEGLNTSNRYHVENGVKRGLNRGIQSAYNGIMYGTCVCEGYTKSMQYLLKLLNIKSKAVSCIKGKNKINVNTNYHNLVTLPDDGFHSIIRVDYNYYCYYCDPCWDSTRWHNGDETLPYCLKNREDISTNHTLCFEEDIISGSYPSISEEYIEGVLKNQSMSR